MEDNLKTVLEEAIRAEYGIQTLDWQLPIKSQIPQGMDKIDSVMLQMIAENAAGFDLATTLTGEENISDIAEIIRKESNGNIEK